MKDFVKNLKYDLPAGLVVFLVALPLCLGVALASGAPMFAGLLSGIIGGVVVGSLSGSQSSVSGPAAGLAAVVLVSIETLGDFDLFLTAVLIAGVIQVIAGYLKAGVVSNYIPSNVIKGLLAAIGIILILKQIPHAVGYDIDNEEDFTFFQKDGENTFSELIKMFDFISPGAVVVSSISLLLLFAWKKIKNPKLKFIPSSLLVVILGILLNYIFVSYIPYLAIAEEHLVILPVIHNGQIESMIRIPEMSEFMNADIWKVAITLAIIASLETLLNIEAIDNLDPHKRQTPTNRELKAQGVGNIVAGIIGGIPITSVIVRSSVNIDSGAKSKASTIIHGLMLISALLFLRPVINMIPLASLAAILIFTGYKLADVALFKDMYAKGKYQFIPFLSTILAIVFTDLLIGILIGSAISIFFLLVSNYKNPFRVFNTKMHAGEIIRIEFPNQVSFLNKATIKDTLWAVPPGSKLVLDVGSSDFIDNDILEILEDFKDTRAVEQNIMLNIIGLKDHYSLIDQIQFVNVLDEKLQDKLNPPEVLNLLKEGNKRFINELTNRKDFRNQVVATSSGQHPMAIIISCIDSRTAPELIFDSSLGDILSVRIAGNVISMEIIGSVELACRQIAPKLIVVMGHSGCGAVDAAVRDINTGNVSYITKRIEPSIQKLNFDKLDMMVTDSVRGLCDKVAQMNVDNSIDELLRRSDYIRELIDQGTVGVVGGYYDIATGIVSFGEMIVKEKGDYKALEKLGE